MCRKILMVIAFERFRDEEFLVPRKHFDDCGFDVTVVSYKKGTAVGMFGHEEPVNVTMAEIFPSDYDAVVFVGGQGTPLVRREPESVELAQYFFENGVVAAICWAPTILAKAGILDGKEVTSWVGNDAEFNMTTEEYIKSKGGNFVHKMAVRDGNVVTGNGPIAAEEFAMLVEEALKELS